MDANVQIADRRVHPRVAIRSVAYVELDDDNGGLILNVSEGGISVQSAEMIVGERFSRIRFRLPKSENWIEAGGKLVWLGKSRKEAGIQFLDLSDDARQHIQTWIYSAAFRPGLPIEQGHFKIVWESEDSEFQASKTPASEEPEIASMFPSEKAVPPTRRSALNVNLNDTPPLELGIAPGPVKRPVLPSESKISQQSSVTDPVTTTPPVHSSPKETREPAFRNRTPYNYPAAPGGYRDPFASIAADRAVIAPPPDVPVPPPELSVFGDAHAADTSAFALRNHYRGLGYNPQPFEEPSGKGWYIAGAILLLLLGVGTVLAIGPANVKSLLAQHIPSSIYSSNPAPPPPANATDKNTDASPSTPSSSVPFEDSPLGTTAERPIVNPGISTPTATQPAANAQPTHPNAQAPSAGSSGEASASAPTERTDTSTTNNDLQRRSDPQRNNDSQLSDSQVADSHRSGAPLSDQGSDEDATEITRRFQMEHSSSNPTSVAPPNGNFSSSTLAPPVTSVAQNPVRTVRNDRTFDAYAEAAPASPPSATTAPAPANTPFQAPAPSAGTVAVSSHFSSLRGEDPQTTMARQGLAVGQLISIHQPVYPVEAERARVEGTVQLRLTIDQTGKVEIVHAIGGPPILVPAAIEAVRQWRYAPTTVEGRAVESVDDVNVVFRLANSASSSR
ncbi:MAG TPA: TonB family protein [Candidatus Acidoferrales bacterium]|nr:TonB family protein [Candidatus Acidoferrales bacterium]